MRLHRLEVEGFGPFRARQVVDFDAFADDGIFLIGGRTGAGKSSILDAVCFGLYGGVPRYDGGEKRLRSDHSEPDEPTEVVVEFSTVAGRFRVTRSPEYLRPAKRGGGLTKQTAAVALEERTDAGWVGRAARAVDVANELSDILQLTQEQFLQVILLAQNRFADFLLSDSRDRQKLLRRLFGTERFEDYQSRFDERRRAAEQALVARRATVGARLEQAEGLVADAELGGDDEQPAAGAGFDERIEALRRALARGEYRSERMDAERDQAEGRLVAADAGLAELKELRQAQTERDRARAALDALEAQAAEIAEAKEHRDRARAAEGLRSVIQAATRAEKAHGVAAEAEAGARATWEAHGIAVAPSPEGHELMKRAVAQGASSERGETDGTGAPEVGRAPGASSERGATELAEADRDPEAAALRAWAAARTGEIGAWKHAAELERQAAERTAAVASARQAVDDAAEALAAVERERDELPAQLAELTARRDTARRQADRVDDLTRAKADAERRRTAAADVDRQTAAQAEAERAVVKASAAHAEAQSALAALRRRRLDGIAGELATALVPGEACAVCGATEHPRPAEHADPVSADDIDEAEASRDAAAGAERTASEHESAVRAALAAVRERADGRTPEQAAAELETATKELAAARAAAEQVVRLDAELQAVTVRRDQNEQRRAEAEQRLSGAREQLALAEQSAYQADAIIAEARSEHASVAARIALVTEQTSDAGALAEAIDVRAARATAASEALADRSSALQHSPFDEYTAAESALLAPAELTALDDRITAHAVALGKERAILLDLELRTLPEEQIDLAPAERAAADARGAWLTAVDAANRTRGTVTQLRGLADTAASEHAAGAEQQAEYDVLRGLADTLAGRGANTHKMNLETFVLAAELEEIVDAANLRLHDMSAGRYHLRHSDALAARGAASGLGIVVFDAFTGQTRPARSLSGGETFLSSLALALGLAEVVTSRAGGIRLDTLFIDEGFGSLDADSLEIAMRTLDELRQGGRTVGVISHVEAMQEQIPAQLTVRTLPDGPSVIDVPV
ncbi:SMC family ATPase [Microbacterium bovistercoris]|uniref:Nuclease SbcCD subunit C n=1 Tax=Microbacterium bovistercoris TaxID=2293570 RepID=A0A371NRY4_9MICO|nr:SMC family ATPase [Microbacterium bovistercoris]REJ04957.1 SMC family ATPase [Microbacterium bovistercoris]